MAEGDLGILNLPGFTIGAAQSSLPGVWSPLIVDAGDLSGRRIKIAQLPSGTLALAETDDAGYYGVITMSTADAAGRAWKLIDIGGVEFTLVQTTVANVWAVLTIDAADASAANYRTVVTDAGNITLVATDTPGKRAVLVKSEADVSGTVSVSSFFGRSFAINGGIVVSGDSGTSPLLTSLVSYWSLEEASGTRNDAYGTNHLTDNNTVTQADGKIAKAAQFTAANSERLSIADNASLSTGDIDFTIAGWAYLDTESGARTLVSKRDNVGNSGEWSLVYDNGVDRFLFFISNNSSASATVTANTFGAVTTGTWYYIVAWRDKAAGTINIQINNGTADSTATAVTPTDTTHAFRIGAQGAGFYHDGRIDELGFWKRVLTAAEKTFLYNAGAGRSFADIQAYRG